MKKRVILFASLLFVLMTALNSANAQPAKRIQFAKGKSSTVVKGTTGEYGMTYVVRARSGQKIVLDLTPTSKVGIKVETNGRYGQTVLLREESGGHYEVGLDENGDYTIFVGSTNHKSINFTLTVRITRLADV